MKILRYPHFFHEIIILQDGWTHQIIYLKFLRIPQFFHIYTRSISACVACSFHSIQSRFFSLNISLTLPMVSNYQPQLHTSQHIKLLEEEERKIQIPPLYRGGHSGFRHQGKARIREEQVQQEGLTCNPVDRPDPYGGWGGRLLLEQMEHRIVLHQIKKVLKEVNKIDLGCKTYLNEPVIKP